MKLGVETQNFASLHPISPNKTPKFSFLRLIKKQKMKKRNLYLLFILSLFVSPPSLVAQKDLSYLRVAFHDRDEPAMLFTRGTTAFSTSIGSNCYGYHQWYWGTEMSSAFTFSHYSQKKKIAIGFSFLDYNFGSTKRISVDKTFRIPGKKVLSVGLDLEFLKRSIDFTSVIWPDGKSGSASGETFSSRGVIVPNFNYSMLLFDSLLHYFAGLGWRNITEPNSSFGGSSVPGTEIPREFNAFAGYNYRILKDLQSNTILFYKYTGIFHDYSLKQDFIYKEKLYLGAEYGLKRTMKICLGYMPALNWNISLACREKLNLPEGAPNKFYYTLNAGYVF
jgi:hypothetical protein